MLCLLVFSKDVLLFRSKKSYCIHSIHLFGFLKHFHNTGLHTKKKNRILCNMEIHRHHDSGSLLPSSFHLSSHFIPPDLTRRTVLNTKPMAPSKPHHPHNKGSNAQQGRRNHRGSLLPNGRSPQISSPHSS